MLRDFFSSPARGFIIAAGAVAISVSVAGLVAAQAFPYRGPIGATTVQLPTFNFFAISTSVEVPDSGQGFLGGVNSAASGSSQRGIPGLGFQPFSTHAIASTAHGGSMSVRATIHDFDAMDKALLGPNFQARAGAAPGGAQPAPGVLATDSAGGSSLAEIRRQQAAEDAVAEAEVRQIIDQGRAYEAAGKPGLAKIQYRMAARRAKGELQQQALANLQRLTAASQAAPSDQVTPK